MKSAEKKIVSHSPKLDLSEGAEMLTDFSQEAQRHLMSALNSVLVLETVATDKEAIENIFKTFHTIKGLADFLHLDDICRLTTAAEALMDVLRKGLLACDNSITALIREAIDSLQRLLELLDEQIENKGKLKSPYHSAENTITSIQRIIERKPARRVAAKKTAPPLINLDLPALQSSLSPLNEAVKKAHRDTVSVDKEILQTFINDFCRLSDEMKEVQSKLQERQRELIREREVAVKLTHQAQQEARAKSEYLANMSHEIRTLINAILGFTDLLKEGGLAEKQNDQLNTIVLSGTMMLEIVNHILDFSKVEAGKLKLELIDFNLEQIVEDVFKIIRSRLAKKPINLYFDIKPDVPRNLRGDPTRIKQIFINLLDNAIKFTEKGEIGLHVSLDHLKKDAQGRLILNFIVRDTGIGIPDDKVGSIFESFTQASESTTRLYGGTGLGLTLCKTFIETMGGNIRVESQLGTGSQFVFDLHIPEGKPGRPAAEKQAREYTGIAAMIVEGHENAAQNLLSLCKKFQLETLPVTISPKQAMESLLSYEMTKKSLPAIIFIDTALPNKEGFMLACKIRQQERYKPIKLVGVSSDVKIESSLEFQQAGFDAFIAKPIIRGEVMELLSRLLGEKIAARISISHDILDEISCEGLRVLVVEDSVPNQELLKVHFAALGCICDFAKNGKEAIAELKKNEYDICFMDLQMPVMGGLEATKIIRNELHNQTPIVALTAAEFQEEKDKCYEIGMNDYLAKPFDASQLKEKIIRCTKI